MSHHTGLCTAVVQPPPHLLLLPAHPGPKATRLLLPLRLPVCRTGGVRRNSPAVTRAGHCSVSRSHKAPLQSGHPRAQPHSELVLHEVNSPSQAPALPAAQLQHQCHQPEALPARLGSQRVTSGAVAPQKPEHPATNPGLIKPQGILLGLSHIRLGSVCTWGNVM